MDYWAHRHADDPELRNEHVTAGFADDLAALEAAEGIPPEAPPDPGDFETVVDGFED